MTGNPRWTIQALGQTRDHDWSQWDRLNGAHFHSHPLLSSTMVRAMAAYFGSTRLQLASLREAEDIVAMALLEPAGRARWSVFCPSQAGVAAIVFDRRLVENLNHIHGLLRALPGIGLDVTLPYQDPEFAWLPACADATVHRTPLGTTMAVRGIADFERYWSERPKELRDNIRRRMKRPEQDGVTMNLANVSGAQEIGAAVDRYGILESSGWKGKNGTALHPDNHQGRFYRELFTKLAAADGALVSELYVGGKLVASRLLVSGPRMHVVLKTTHDEELRNYAPGHLQLYLLMRELLAVPEPRDIEFYTKATRDWLLWATHTRVIDTVSVYRNRWIAALADWRRRKRAQASVAADGAAADAA